MATFKSLAYLAKQQREMHEAMKVDMPRQKLLASIEQALINRVLPKKAVVVIEKDVPHSVFVELLENDELMKELVPRLVCQNCDKIYHSVTYYDKKCLVYWKENYSVIRCCASCREDLKHQS